MKNGILNCDRKVGDDIILIPRTYPYYDVVVGLAWSYDPESYAGGSVAAGRVSRAGQVKVMIQTKRDTMALQVGGWAWVLTAHLVKGLNC
jgi:hypothetical protein